MGSPPLPLLSKNQKKNFKKKIKTPPESAEVKKNNNTSWRQEAEIFII